jgi:FxsC-like protein
MPSERIPLMARAQELGIGIRGYTEDGLQAMSRLSHLRAAYDEFLQRLADEIVRVAERETLVPSAPPALSGVPRKIHLRTPLVVSVLAPTDGQLPPGRESGPYGAASADWRPYGRTDGPSIAEVASTVVEQLDLDADVVNFDQSTDIFGRTPAVVLIDPWIFADPRHGDDIVTALLRLPAWVRLLAIVDKSDPQYDPTGAEMVTAMNAILATPFRERLTVVENIDTFVSEARGAIVRVLRDYLRLGPVYPPPGPHPPLPRLTVAGQADTPGE